MKNNNGLPTGYHMRPATMEDVGAATAMFNACSQHLLGIDELNVDTMRVEWQIPSFNLSTDSRLVIDPRGNIAAYYDYYDGGDPHVLAFGWGRVHPEHRDRGLATCLIAWLEERAHQNIPLAPPEARVVMRLFANNLDEAAGQLFFRSGYQLVRHSLRMVIHLNGAPPRPQWPEGIIVRPMQRGQDEWAIVRAVDGSFQDHWGHVDRPLEEQYKQWMLRIEQDPRFDPDLWFIALDGDQVAGISLCRKSIDEDPSLGWVGTLGVLRPWRRKGVGLALLEHSFAELYRRGQRKIGLGVDASSLTGATRLYEKAGMRSDPARTFAIYEKELRPGVDLTTNSVSGEQ